MNASQDHGVPEEKLHPNEPQMVLRRLSMSSVDRVYMNQLELWSGKAIKVGMSSVSENAKSDCI